MNIILNYIDNVNKKIFKTSIKGKEYETRNFNPTIRQKADTKSNC